jgi:hypothetical protein
MKVIHKYFLLTLKVKHKEEALFYVIQITVMVLDFLQGLQPLLKVHYFTLGLDVQKI